MTKLKPCERAGIFAVIILLTILIGMQFVRDTPVFSEIGYPWNPWEGSRQKEIVDCNGNVVAVLRGDFIYYVLGDHIYIKSLSGNYAFCIVSETNCEGVYDR